MKSRGTHDTAIKPTSRRKHRLHSTLIKGRFVTSTAVTALFGVISVSATVPAAHGKVRESSIGSATAIATARQVATERPSDYLEGLRPGECGQVVLEVEIAGPPMGDNSLRSSMVESLWRDGRYEDALYLLRTLEDQELLASVGFNWRAPREMGRPQDVKSTIDGTGGAGQVELEYDPSTGNIFALVRWGGSWGLFISDDQGASWTESFHYSGLFLVGMKVDLELHNSTTHGDYAYVAYSYNGNLTGTTSVARVRRFAASNGAYDESWGTNTPITDETRNFKEIDLSVGEWIEFVILRDDGRILDLVGKFTHPHLQWFNQDTDVTDADRGLSVAYPGPDSEYIGLFITYVGFDDRISMARRARPSGFLPFINVESPPQPWAETTSIVANGDIAIVAWQCRPNSGTDQGVRSKRVVATSTFAIGIERFDGPELYSPGVDLHHPQVAGIGKAIVYTSGSEILYRERASYTSGWSDDVSVLNAHAIDSEEGHAFAFEWLGSEYGVAYFDAAGDVYFTTNGNAGGMLFGDGFESGNLGKWSSVTN